MTSGKLPTERFLANELDFWQTLEAVYIDGVQLEERDPILRPKLQDVKVLDLATKRFQRLVTYSNSLKRQQINEFTKRVKRATGAKDLDPFDFESVKRWKPNFELPIPPGRAEPPSPRQPPTGRSVLTGPPWAQYAFIDVVVTVLLLLLGYSYATGRPLVPRGSGSTNIEITVVESHKDVDYGLLDNATCDEIEAMSFEGWRFQLDGWSAIDNQAKWTTTFICGSCGNIMRLIEENSIRDWLVFFPEDLNLTSKLLVYAREWECEQD